jgi:hypothetical protein
MQQTNIRRIIACRARILGWTGRALFSFRRADN